MTQVSGSGHFRLSFRLGLEVCAFWTDEMMVDYALTSQAFDFFDFFFPVFFFADLPPHNGYKWTNVVVLDPIIQIVRGLYLNSRYCRDHVW